MGYVSQYPPVQDTNYVKSTSEFAGGQYSPFAATNPAKGLTGAWGSLNNWLSANTVVANQRFHIDLGSNMIIKRIYYENSHSSGGTTNSGAKNYLVQGSTVAGAFAQLTYGTNTDWTEIQSGLQFNQHAAVDAADPKYQVLTNTNTYRYFAIKIADNWTSASYMGLRRIVLQTLEVPTVVTTYASVLSTTSVELTGNVTGDEPATLDEIGFDIGTSPGTYTSEVVSTGTFSNGIYRLTATGLTASTIYYFRAKAHNATGDGYGAESYFYTSPISNYANNTGMEVTTPMGITFNDCRMQSVMGVRLINTNTMTYVRMPSNARGLIPNKVAPMGLSDTGTVPPQYLDRGRHKLDFLPISSGYKQST
jgi:hypothetical protein